MKLISFNGIDFTALGVRAPKFSDPTSPGSDIQVDAIPRAGADPSYGGTAMGPQVITAEFSPNGTDTETTLMTVLGALNYDDSTEKILVAELLNGTQVQTYAKAGPYRYVNTNVLAVDFVITTPGWYETEELNLVAVSPTADGSFVNGNTGLRDLPATIRVMWTPPGTQRSSSTADIGWKHRLGSGLTITNNGTEPLINQPYQIGPIDHAALVTAGQGLSNGNDLRVFCEGQELNRNLIGANTKYVFIWVILPTVAPGQSITLDILTNNPSAGSPPTLTFNSTPMRPGMDISGASFTGASSTGSFTITKVGAGWETNQWAGGTVIIQSASSSKDKILRRIVSNTATVLTLDEIISTSLVAGDTVTIVKSGLRGTGGYIWSNTSTTIDLSPNTFNANEWIGATVEILTGAAAGQKRTVLSNTASTLVVSSAFSPLPASPDSVRIYQSNGSRMWDVRQPPKTTNYPGLWQANKIQAPPTQVSFDAPASWYRFTYQPGSDAYSQPRYDSFSVGAGDYDHVPIMNIQRARKGKAGSQKEVGIADAIGVHSPFPINGTKFGYTLRSAKKAGSGSPGEGMCEARFMTQEAGGELWSTFLSDVAVHNSTATVSPAWYDLTGYGSPNRIAMTLIPNGSDEIPSADSNTAQLRSTGDYVAIAVNPQSVITESVDWFTSPPTTVAVYDFSLILRTGGVSANTPYYRLVIGGADHRLFMQPGHLERLAIDCERRTVSLTDGTDVYIRRIPYAVQAQQVVTDTDGTERVLVADRWLPIPPASIDPADIYFDDPSGAGWGQLTINVDGTPGYRT